METTAPTTSLEAARAQHAAWHAEHAARREATHEDEAPTWEPIRVPTDATATKWCVNRNWNRRGAHTSKEIR